MKPLRGEVWLWDLGMVEKVRPALVVSVNYGDRDRALITVVPHTTSLRGSEFEITVPVAFLRPRRLLGAECCNLSRRSGNPQARRIEEGTV